MAAIAGAVIAAGSQLYGGHQAGKAQQRAQRREQQLNEQQRRGAFNYLQGARGKDEIYAGLEEAQLKRSNAAALKGFDSAKKAQSLGAQSARQIVLNRGAQAQAQQQQGLVSKGLIGTTSGTSQASDLSGQVTQQLAGIDTELANTLGQLGLAQGIQESRGIEKLASLANSTRAYNQDVEYELANLAPAQLSAGEIQQADFRNQLARWGGNRQGRNQAQSATAPQGTWVLRNGTWVLEANDER